MAQYRSKSTVDAVKWLGKDDTNRILNWLSQQAINIKGWVFHDTDITIPTPEGRHVVTPGNWIVQNAKGEVYSYTSEFFDLAFELVA